MGRGPKGLRKPMKLVSAVQVPEGAANCICKCQVAADVTSWIQMPGGE